MASWASGGMGAWLTDHLSGLQCWGQHLSQGSPAICRHQWRGCWALGGGGFVEKKLMLSLVTTLTRQKAPKEDMLFFSFCPPPPPRPKAWTIGYSWVSKVQCLSSSFYSQAPLFSFPFLRTPVHLHIPETLTAAVLVLVTEVIQR